MINRRGRGSGGYEQMHEISFLLSIGVRLSATLLLLVAGGYCAFRPRREIERRVDVMWPHTIVATEQRFAILLASGMLIGLVWII
ncbi:MAG: hypothetical protein KF861_20415 [Planctomycetaceae bacterium]|nr:hypothetical protein [Planctomycetaceae bacterium]